MIKITKRYPVPTQTRGTNSYPFAKMVIGDSFGVPNSDLKKVTSAVQNFRTRTEGLMQFTIRKHGRGMRVWRVK
jgi:hypothetical protein